MSDYTEDELTAIWQKGRKIDGMDPNVYRLDAADALMKRGLYGNEGNLGWEVDHIYPKEKLKAKRIPEDMWNDIVNLRPMNAKNNVSKGENYPVYERVVKWDRSVINSHKNIAVSKEEARREVCDSVQEEISAHYKKWLQD